MIDYTTFGRCQAYIAAANSTAGIGNITGSVHGDCISTDYRRAGVVDSAAFNVNCVGSEHGASCYAIACLFCKVYPGRKNCFTSNDDFFHPNDILSQVSCLLSS